MAFKSLLSEQEVPEQTVTAITEIMTTLFTKVNTLASKAYEKELSVAGLGMFLRWACDLTPTMLFLFGFIDNEYPSKTIEIFLFNYNRFF